ncbi:LOW QUALITY PROTEIN: protein unc-93 homolog B1 [Scyliorhinus torazame]
MESDILCHGDARQNGMAAAERPLNCCPDNQGDDQIDDFLAPNQDYNEEEEERKYFRRKRLAVLKNVVCASLGIALTYGVYLGLLQMQLILHYDETYREVKYGNMELEDIDKKMLMGINVTPIVALLYTPVLIRFLGTKWMMFLAIGIYALFVSTNYWERYYTLVPSAVAIGAAIVPLWASVGNYITRMAQKYYEYVNYKEDHVQEQKRPPKGACHRYIIIFQSIFYCFFHLSFVFAEMPMIIFLNGYLFPSNHTLHSVKHCGTEMVGMLQGLNKTVLIKLPQSVSLIVVESVLMAVAFVTMLLVLILCGPAYRPTEEIDLRSIGWGNIFQLPFKHMRDYRLRHLLPFFIYSGFEVLFACTGFTMSYGVCSVGLERLASILIAYGVASSVFSLLSLSMLRLHRSVPLLAGAAIQLVIIIGLFCWAPSPKNVHTSNLIAVYAVAILWGMGTALNKTSLIREIYSQSNVLDVLIQVKLSILLVTLVIAVLSYLWMEHKLLRQVPFRIPRIPKPRHKVRGYRYLEDENSDQSDDEEKPWEDGEPALQTAEEDGAHPVLQEQRLPERLEGDRVEEPL